MEDDSSFTKPTSKKVKKHVFVPTAKKEYINPSLRWKTQILLQNVCGEYRSEPIQTQNSVVVYCRRLEEVIFLHTLKHPVQYSTKIKQLVYALLKNYVFLMEKYEPSQLVCLDDDLLFENTKACTERKKKDDNIAACRKILEATEPSGGGTSSIATCDLCGGEANYVSKQVRSADEGMTIFCYCKTEGCNNKWKFDG